MPMLCCQELLFGDSQSFTKGQVWQHIFLIFLLLLTPLPFDVPNEGDLLELSGSYLVREY